jgi:hypothetical protein
VNEKILARIQAVESAGNISGSFITLKEYLAFCKKK